MKIKNQIKSWVLPNGLRLVVQPIKDSKIVVINSMYHVGACNEDPNKTGIAHLLEHIMCAGSGNIDSYDNVLQKSGGTNNAYTSWDATSYWCRLPTTKLAIGLWVESERMFNPKFDEGTIDTQRKVVIEEFKQVCLAKPYGDVWHSLLPLAYQKHPYKWPVIGKETSHIASITRNDIMKFHGDYYHPKNAVLSIVGGVQPEATYELVKKWFGLKAQGVLKKESLPKEPTQEGVRRKTIQGNVPEDAIYIAYKMGGRRDGDYLATEVVAAILGEGDSSWLHVDLIEKKKIFNSVQAYTLDTIDPGLLVIAGRPAKGVSLKEAENYLRKSCQELLSHEITAERVAKACNQLEADFKFSQVEAIEQVDHLAWATLLKSPTFLEEEMTRLSTITPAEITRVASAIIQDRGSSIIYYGKKEGK